MLWRIEGFSSTDPIPGPLDAPTPIDMAKQTRSYFTPTLYPARPAMFTRLAQFHTPDCGIQFFLRFRMFRVPGKRPILAFANAKGKTFFWDFERFGEYARYMDALKEAKEAGRYPLVGEGAVVPKPVWLPVRRAKKTNTANNSFVQSTAGDGTASLRSFAAMSVVGSGGGGGGGGGGGDKESMVSASPDPESNSALPTSGLGYNRETLDAWAEMYDATDPVRYIKPHRTIQIEGGFVGRQVGWSLEGEWCVVVGNGNRAVIYQRWAREKGTATPVG